MMKRLSSKKILALLVSAIAVWMCLLLGTRVQGMMCDGVYVLSYRQEDRYFSSADLSGIEGEGIQLTFAQPVYPKISNGFRREEAEVFLTNENYAYIANAYMKRGAFLNGAQVSKGLSVAVLSERAAYCLFGNCNCVGETIYLNNTSFQIVGIIEEQGANAAKVYIPYSTMEYMGISELKAGQLWCRFSNLADAAAVMKKTGCPVEELNILQMDFVKDIFWQRFDLPLILTGAYVVLRLCRKIAEKIERIGSERGKWEREVCIGVFCVVGVCTGIVLLWKLAAASWCVPPAYELLGGSWRDVLYCVLDFYLLINIKVDNMRFLTHWNVLSLLFMTMYLYLFSLYCVREM